MSNTAILYPCFAMALITLYISIRLTVLRHIAVLRDGLNPSFFKHNRGGKPPEYLLRSEDHYVNIYEQPVLFYVVCILIYISGQADPFLLGLAWAYIGSRILHGIVHLHYNRITWRRNAFYLSSLVLFSQWGYLFSQLITQS